MKMETKASNRSPRLIHVFTWISLLALATAAYGSDWPHWRGPNYNGISEEKDWDPSKIKEDVKPLWQASIGTGFATVSISKGKVYAIGNKDETDTVYCFNAETGKEIWKQSYPCPLFNKNHEGGPAATPTINGDYLYTLSKNSDAICFNAATGKIIWQKNLVKELGVKQLTWHFAGSPLVIDNMLILNAGTSGVALNKTDGSVIWQNGNEPAGYATPVPYNKNTILLFTSNKLVCLSQQTGKQIWEYQWETSYNVNAADPIFEDDKIFISSGYNKGCALLKVADNKISELWVNKNMRNHFNSSVLWKGYIYGVDDKQLNCLDFKTGEVKWAHKGLGKGSLMIADGKMIILSETGRLVIANASPDGFKEISSAQILTGRCWTVPVLADGRIYARNAVGDLVCLDVRKKDSATSAASSDSLKKNDWPQWQGPNQDNKSLETGLLKQWPEGGPKMLWSAQGLGTGFSTVSIADGFIFTTGIINQKGILFAFDLQGNLKWQKEYGPEWTDSHPGTRGTPVINDGCVYVISGRGAIACFDAKTGQLKWDKDVFTDFGGKYGRYGIAESPVIVGNMVTCTPGGEKAAIVALDKKTGNIAWASKSTGEASAYCTPRLIEMKNKKTLITMMENFIIGVDAENGEILWQYDCKNYQGKPKSTNPNTPLYYDGYIYVTSGYGKGGAKLKLSDDGTKILSQEWANLKLDCRNSGVVLVDGYIYGSNMKGKWICLDWKDGKVMYENDGIGIGSIFYADGMLYCYGDNGTVALVKASPDAFNIVSSFNVPKGDGPLWAHPVICDGKLYVRHGDALMVYEIKAS